jgi:GNAT superfamily N-acetyltransferase
MATTKPAAKTPKRRCPRLQFEQTEYSVVARASGGKLAGALYLNLEGRGMGEELVVGTVRVAKEYQRCGVATQLYTRAAAIARAAKLPLVSDATRSEAAESFWRKQVQKGRAVCLRKGDGATKLAWDEERGFHPVKGRWECARYALKPEARDLSGLKKRKH